MYTSVDRERLLRKIEQFTKAIDGVQGLLLVGSGALGFRDQYSDLDVVVVVKNSDHVQAIHDQLCEYLQMEENILKYKVYQHEIDIFVTCFFFDHYLELDLGVWTYEKVKATKPNWIVIFDKDQNQLENKLTHSIMPQVSNHKLNEEAVDDSLSIIWQFFRSSAIALKRKQYVKAVKDIDFIRNQIIQFICILNDIEYDFDKMIDSIDGPFVQRLKSSYEVCINQESIKKVLFEIMNLYFDVVAVINLEKGNNNKIIIRKFLLAILD